METLLKYIKSEYPHIVDEYKRKTTLNYYEGGGVLYKYIRENRNSRLFTSYGYVIKNADYKKDGNHVLNLCSVDCDGKENGDMYRSIDLNDAHRELTRVTNKKPKGYKIPNSFNIIYITVGEKEFSITQSYYRNNSYVRENSYMCARVNVTCESEEPFSNGNKPSFELYSMIGDGKFNLRYTYGRTFHNDESELKMGINIRQFKSIVFGDHKTKLKCQLFGN